MSGNLVAEHRKKTRDAKKLLNKANLIMHVASVATAVEALERILIRRGILEPDQLMKMIACVAEEKNGNHGSDYETTIRPFKLEIDQGEPD